MKKQRETTGLNYRTIYKWPPSATAIQWCLHIDECVKNQVMSYTVIGTLFCRMSTFTFDAGGTIYW